MQQLLDSSLVLFGDAALALLALALGFLVKWLAGKVKNEHLSAMILRTDDLALKVVRDVYQAYVEPQKKAGQWSAETHELAKAKALAELKSYLGVKGLADIASLLGSASIDEYLGTLLENAVQANKQAAAPLALGGASRAPLASEPSTAA